MPPTEQCRAIAPRLAPCADDLLLASIRELGDDALTRQISKEIGARPARGSSREAVLTFCLGNANTTAFVTTVLRCWDTRSCDAFVRCVLAPRAGG